MTKELFSVPIFFIIFREALETSIVIAVLLSLVEGIVRNAPAEAPADHRHSPVVPETKSEEAHGPEETHEGDEDLDRALLRKLRIQIFAGAATGLFVALAIGAAFIAVWFTQVNDLFGTNEEVWEGVFNLVAALLIFGVALTMLRMDTAKARWKHKLQVAFDAHRNREKADRAGRSSKYALFILPFITVLREGLEAVIFIGGVSLGQKATAIPIAAIVGLICGFLVGYIIYLGSSRTRLTFFLVLSTNLLLLLGAGLFSKSVGNFERNRFNKLVGGDVAEAGNGPGSYDVDGNIWHLNCCNPENKFEARGWSIFNAIFGWSNNGSVGTVLAYIFYWLAAIAALVYMKHSEGRLGKRTAVRKE